MSAYAFDPYANNPANIIVDEYHNLTYINSRQYYILLPRCAPFFSDDIQVKHRDQHGRVTLLTRDVDYQISLMYLGATRSTGKPVYGAITLSRYDLVGEILVTYHTLGGKWVADTDAVLKYLVQKVYNPRITTWDQVTNVQDIFPPTEHQLNLDNVQGYEVLVQALNGIADTISGRLGNSTTNDLHPSDKNNPHAVTKAQVGLDQVENLPLATGTEVSTHTKINKYVTLTNLIDIHDELYTLLAPHLADTNNPHLVTKEQLGLDQVENLPIATDEDIANNVAARKYTTLAQILTLLERVQNNLTGDISGHLIEYDNPHQVTKEQVGLGEVQNLNIATDAEVDTEASAYKYVTLAQVVLLVNRLRTLIQALSDATDLHINDKTNPHAVTKEQVGLDQVENLPLLTQIELDAETPADKYSTFTQQLTLANKLRGEYEPIGTDLLDHVTDTANPHTVTKAQVGLGDVDNTADAVKQVLSATKFTTARLINGVSFDGTADITINAVDSTARIASSEKGAPNGVATLDSNGFISSAQIPGTVDEILEYDTFGEFPATGELKKIYLEKQSNKIYRWSGSVYIEISPTTGTADQATTLATARQINGALFDGSVDITTTQWGTAREITIGGTMKSVDGGSNVGWSLTEIGAVAANTAIPGGTYTKITYDPKGLVTGGSNLAATDIPDLDTGKLTTGTLAADRFDDTSHGARSGGTLHSVATTTTAGFMSATDKTALDAALITLADAMDRIQALEQAQGVITPASLYYKYLI